MSMRRRDTLEHKPNIGHKYILVYLKGTSIIEYLGSESTGEYYIADSEGLVGCEKFNSGSIRSHMTDEYFKSLDKHENYFKIIKIGHFTVDKINIWNTSHFTPWGTPDFHDPIFEDSEISKWQTEFNKSYKTCDLQKIVKDIINKSKKMEKEINDKKKRIEKDGYDKHKPLTKENHPPSMTWPPTTYNGVDLQLGTGASGYKFIHKIENGYGWKLMEYPFKSKIYDSPLIAAYEYTIRNNPEKYKKQLNEIGIFAENIYLTSNYSDKDTIRSLGGKWDSEKKKWYIPSGLKTAPFEKWLQK